ncbi:hypothetical protein EDB85DRAFT_2154905 [Lactarius pseudohatsudake]|nr:hypothetical protein EDB85DRAFT_2154905 [Lactarius pseudohatsudake]
MPEDRPTPHAVPFIAHKRRKGAHEGGAHEGTPSPPGPSPSPTSVPRGRDARGHAAAPSRGHPRFSLPPVRAAHLFLSPRCLPSHSHGRSGHEGTPPSLPSAPPFSIRVEGVRTRARRPLAFGPTPSPLTAPPIRTEGVRAHEDDAPGTSPSPLAAPPRTRRKGHAAPSPRHPRHLPFPPRTRGMEAREGTPPPVPPPFPIRAEGGCARTCRPVSPSPPTSPFRTVRAGWRHARARHPRPPTLPHSRGRGARDGMPLPTLPFSFGPRHPVREGTPRTLPHSRGRGRTECMPPRTRRTGARECTPPPPPFPLVRATPFARKGGMRGQAAPSRGAPFAREWAHEAKPEQQDRAPAFTAPAPRLRGIVRLRRKIDVA